jgi:hypothetical protein
LPPDDRIWLPDLNAVLDWDTALLDGTEKRYGGEATWWTQATPGVNYYRADLPAKHLPGKTIRFENRVDLQIGEDGEPFFPRQEGNSGVWMFPGTTGKFLLMAGMKDLGYRVLVEVDDNYTVPPSVPQLSSWLVTRDKSGADEASYEVHCRIVRSPVCDGVIVSTPYLADVYRRLNPNVWVCPNSIDPTDWPDEEPPHQPDGVLRIGWAGSVSHLYDLADIRPALDWASRQKDVEVVVMGQLDLGLKHRAIPWTDSLAEYRRNVSEIDVMLCPIRPNPWANGKSDVKALEGAMGGAVPVVSRTEPFRPWWDHDAPCLVADSKKGFVKAVKHLVANREETRQLARAARAWVLKHRQIKDSVEAWREALCLS